MSLSETGRDLAASVCVWMRAPMLPILTVALTVAVTVTGSVRGPWFVVALVISIAMVGFYGAQRLWYADAFRGRPFSLQDAYEASVAMFGRFFSTGVTVFVPLVLVLFVFDLLIVGMSNDTGRVVVAWSNVAVTVIADLLLTFVTPALAFTTPDARHAIGIGLRMIRRTWPDSALYVVAPPITLQLLAVISPTRLGLTLGIVAAAVSALFGLWWKGATAAYYLRHAVLPR